MSRKSEDTHDVGRNGHDLEPYRLRIFHIAWNVRPGPLDKVFSTVLGIVHGVDIRPGGYAPKSLDYIGCLNPLKRLSGVSGPTMLY